MGFVRCLVLAALLLTILFSLLVSHSVLWVFIPTQPRLEQDPKKRASSITMKRKLHALQYEKLSKQRDEMLFAENAEADREAYRSCMVLLKDFESKAYNSLAVGASKLGGLDMFSTIQFKKDPDSSFYHIKATWKMQCSVGCFASVMTKRRNSRKDLKEKTDKERWVWGRGEKCSES